MTRINSYMEFINEEFFKKMFNKKKSKTSKKSRLDSCLFNILEFLKENGVNDWNDFINMSQFDRQVVDQIIDHEVKNKFLTSILSESERVSRLINNILDLEKLATGKEKLELKENSIKETISKSINSVLPLAEKKKIKINAEGVNNANLIYDEDRIQQVIINLLSNAIKFSNEEIGSVSVYTYQNENNIEISIEDNGIEILIDELVGIKM